MAKPDRATRAQRATVADKRGKAPRGAEGKAPERERARAGAEGAAAAPAWLLYLVVFVCGAVLMGLEMRGSRISIFLAALTLGYFLGGLVADRWPHLRVMAVLVAAPGAMIFALPFLYPAINRAIASNSLGPRWDPLLAAVIL